MEVANGHQNGAGFGHRRTRGGDTDMNSKMTTDEKLAGDQAKLRQKKLKELQKRFENGEIQSGSKKQK